MTTPGDSFRDRAAEIAKRHGLDLLVLFGSRATGRTHVGSDVDLAVRCASGRAVAGERLLDLQADLGDLFAGTEVDLADLSRADPLFAKKIFEHAVPLYSAPGAFDDARLRALHRYVDYQPMLRLEHAAVRRALGLHAR